jgi:hypothetical protein
MHLPGRISIDTILGKKVLIKRPHVTFNERGDANKTFSATEDLAEIQELSGDESVVRAGVLETGDALGFFRAATDIRIGDIVEYGNKEWRVIGIVNERIGDTIVFKEVHLSKELG